MTEKPRLGERFRYRFDTWMSRGTVAIMALLGIATVVFVLVLGALSWLFLRFAPDGINEPGDDPWDIIWGSLMRTLDPGTMGGDEGWGFRLLMLAVTIGGLIIVASLIGIVSGAFDAKIEQLRKGRSRVLETDHVLILGWSPKVFTLVAELAIANASRRRSVIVVLADRDKVEMEDAIRAEVPGLRSRGAGSTRVICRSGDPMNLTDLELGSPHDARSIVLLAGEGDDDPDSTVIRTALALTNHPDRRADRFHIVGELKDPRNLEAARLVGRDEAHWVLASELIARVTVQSCRQSGLSVVYTDLLDFGGDEFYVTAQPSLSGLGYAEVQTRFPDSTVVGIISGGRPRLNPPGDTVYGADDELIVLAEDDSTIRVGAPEPIDTSRIVDAVAHPAEPEHTIILGANPGLPGMLAELDEYVAAGSTALVVAPTEPLDLPPLERLEVRVQRGDPTSRRVLDGLGVERSDHIIVVAERQHSAVDRSAVQRADARTLITLLHLRDIADALGSRLNVVSEMLDDRNRELAEVTDADDFIVSEKLVSLMLSQVSENRRIAAVFEELFSSAGSEIYVRPAEWYVRPGAAVTFATVVEAARRRGETAIGYRVDADARRAERGYGVVVNPRKDADVAFAPGDRVIVLADG